MPLIMQLDADTKKATSKIKAASKTAGANVKKLEQDSVVSANKMSSSFKSLAGIAGIGSVSIALRAATKQLIGFETAMAEVSTLVDTTQVNMGELNKDILRLTTVIPRSAIDISKGLYQTLSAGITDTGEALFFLEEASKAAVAGISDTQTAVTIAAAVMNAFGKEVKDVTNINDILFLTVKEGVTNFEQLAASLGNVVTIAAQTGVSFEEVAAATAALTKSGLKTAEAVTAIRGVLVAVLKQSGQSVTAAAKLGLQFDVQALKAKGLTGFLKDVGEATQGDAEITQKLFGRVEALTAVLALAGDQSETYTTILDKMSTASGTANEAFEKLNETTESQIQLLKNRLNVDLQSLSGAILPSIVFAFDSFLFALSPVNTLLDKQAGFVKNAKENFSEIIPTLGGFATAMMNAAIAQAEFLKAGVSTTKETDEVSLLQRRSEQVEAIEGRELKIRDISEERITLILQALGISRETFDLQRDLVLLAQDKVLLEEASNTIITTRLKKVNEIFNLEIQARINAINAAEATEEADKNSEGIARNQQRAAAAAGTFSQNLARALISGQGLEKSLLSAAINLGLSFLPGGSLFGRFAHGGIAPGGFVPSIAGEGGGAPEIIQSATPIRVTPLTTHNTRSITMPVTIQVIQQIDEFTLQDQIIPMMNELAADGARILASEVI